jgi:hypothetical protein
MKRISIFLVLIFGLFACNSNKQKGLNGDVINNPLTASGNTDPSKLPVITFDQTSHDFGKVIEGEKVTHSFKFKNTGKSDLVISNVIASCGCTVPTFPKDPIKPGNSDYINVQFDSKGRSGNFSKEVTIFANTIPNSTQIIIKGNISKN